MSPSTPWPLGPPRPRSSRPARAPSWWSGSPPPPRWSGSARPRTSQALSPSWPVPAAGGSTARSCSPTAAAPDRRALVHPQTTRTRTARRRDPMSTVLITGAATGIGNLTAKALARAGHRVYATMRAPEGRNAPRAQELRDFAAAEGADIRVVELDVASQESADDAVHAGVADCGELDVVIHNAGHLLVGYVE